MSSRAKSILQSAAGVGSEQILWFVTAAILGRILDPSDFGIVALLTLINGFFVLFASAGMASVIVQFRSFGKSELQACLGMCWVIGAVLAFLSIVISGAVSEFFSSPELLDVLRVGSLSLLLIPQSQIIDGYLVRESHFAKRAYLNVVISAVVGISSITLAIVGFGYWALVAQIILRPLVYSMVGFTVIQFAPIPRWDFKLYQQFGRYAMNLIGFRAVYYWTQNLDNLMIGSKLRVFDLGVYTRAYTLYSFASSLIQAVFGPLLHTRLAEIKDVPSASKKEVLDSISLIASMSFPVMGVVSVYASEIVMTVWGAQWSGAVLPFTLLACAGMLYPLAAITGAAFKALDYTLDLVYWGIFKFIISMFAIYAGLSRGIVGVACAVVLIEFLFWVGYSNVALMFRVSIRLGELVKSYCGALKICSIMVVLAAVLKYWVLSEFDEISRLMISMPVFILTYFWLNYVSKTPLSGVLSALCGINKSQ